MFTPHSPEGYSTPLDKIRQKTLAWGEKSLLVEFRLEVGALIPPHAHPHEQTGYLVAGRLELTIGGSVHVASPGDGWSIAGGIEHQARALEACVAVEVFSPLREDYLPADA